MPTPPWRGRRRWTRTSTPPAAITSWPRPRALALPTRRTERSSWGISSAGRGLGSAFRARSKDGGPRQGVASEGRSSRACRRTGSGSAARHPLDLRFWYNQCAGASYGAQSITAALPGWDDGPVRPPTLGVTSFLDRARRGPLESIVRHFVLPFP